MTFGFIITRHVNSELTNKYWNQCVKLIRTYYPNVKIIIIDDNSNQSLIKADYPYKNVTIIHSEYPQRGELLPFIYFIRNKWFDNAIMIHDSVFIHKKINFSKFILPVIPLWHFPEMDDQANNTMRILQSLKNNKPLIEMKISNSENIKMLGIPKQNWIGVFGCQCFINHNFLLNIQNKYNIVNLINSVHIRADRCSLERVFGLIFVSEFPLIKHIKSVFGNIMTYQNFNYTFDEYYKEFNKKRVPKPWVKTWTGR
jgi:hypothetical protein